FPRAARSGSPRRSTAPRHRYAPCCSSTVSRPSVAQSFYGLASGLVDGGVVTPTESTAPKQCERNVTSSSLLNWGTTAYIPRLRGMPDRPRGFLRTLEP